MKHVWLADPVSQTLSVYDGSWHDLPQFELAELEPIITPEQVFG